MRKIKKNQRVEFTIIGHIFVILMMMTDDKDDVQDEEIKYINETSDCLMTSQITQKEGED